jgi:hypothetical protein
VHGPRDVPHRARRGGGRRVIRQRFLQLGDLRREGRVDVHADRRACPGGHANGLDQQRQVEDADDEAGEIAAPVRDLLARRALGVDGNGDENVGHPAAPLLRLEEARANGCDAIVVARALQHRPALRNGRVVHAIDRRGLRLSRVEHRKIFVALRCGDESLTLQRLDPIAGHAVGDRRGLVFGALLAVDARQPGNAQHAGMALEQAGAEGLEFAASDFVAGRFEQRAQCEEPRYVLVHAVLHDDRLGLGGVLELAPVDAIFPPRHGGGAHDREQKADADRHERRAIKPEQRRGTPPSAHTPPILIVLIATAHLDLQVPIDTAARTSG